MKTAPLLAAAAAVSLAMLSTPAMAHPKLVSATPAAKATASNVTKATLKFSEALVAPVSGADLIMTGMPGMSHPPSKVTGVKTALAADGKTLVATFPQTRRPAPMSSTACRLDRHAQCQGQLQLHCEVRHGRPCSAPAEAEPKAKWCRCYAPGACFRHESRAGPGRGRP